MNDPERLVRGEAGAFERRLLQAGRGEEMPALLAARMRNGLGLPEIGAGVGAAVGVGAVLTGKASAAGIGAGVTSGSLVAGKLGFVVIAAAAIAGGVVGGLLVRGDNVAARASTHARATAHPAVVAPPVAGEPAPVDVAAAVLVPSPADVTAQPVAAGLAAELTLIDHARADLAKKRASAALASLERYQRRFPRGALAPEADALRIEALAQQGRAAEARTLARRFLARHPQSPLAAKIERLAR